MMRKHLCLLALLTLVMLSLLSCNRTTPAPTTLPEPTVTPTAERTPTSTDQPTAMPTPRPTATPASQPTATATPTSVPITLRDDLYRNEALGINWERPDDSWKFVAVSTTSQPGSVVIPLVSLTQERNDGNRGLTLLASNTGVLQARAMYLEFKLDPNQALASLAGGMGEIGKSGRLTTIVGAPAVVAEIPSASGAKSYLWIISQPKRVFYLTANGFDWVLDAEKPLKGLTLNNEGMITAPQVTQPVDAALPSLIAAAEDIRELKTRQAVPIQFMTRDNVRDLLQSRGADPSTAAERVSQGQMFKLLGVIPEDVDFEGLLLDVYSAQISGFYDAKTKDFVIVQATATVSKTLTVEDKFVFVHEYAHALQDQYFDLDRYIGEAAGRMNADQRQAVRALVEGDATLVAGFWGSENLTPSQIIGLAKTGIRFDTAVLDKAPSFLLKSLTFPYVSGLTFVQQISLTGGWERVAQVWKHAPVSTEQILHPEKYPEDVPSLTALPANLADQLGGGWRETDRDVWGELDLTLLLAEELPDEATAGAAGWDGSEYVFLMNGGKRLFVMELAWDSLEEAKEGHKVFTHWLVKRGFRADDGIRYQTKAQAAALQLQGDRLFLCLGDDAAAVSEVAGIW